jgi:hypothetical protein
MVLKAYREPLEDVIQNMVGRESACGMAAHLALRPNPSSRTRCSRWPATTARSAPYAPRGRATGDVAVRRRTGKPVGSNYTLNCEQ